MNKLYDYCDVNGIDVFFSVVDSILIKKSELPKLQQFMGTDLGKLHVETESNEAIIRNKGAIYLNEDWFRWSGKSLKGVATSGIRELFLK
jgi:hypothetical protein